MKFFKILVFSFLFWTISIAQNFTGGYNFYIPSFDSTTQEFLPTFPKANINNFVTINQDGNFSVNGERIKFWGVNFVADGAFINKEITPGVAARLNKLGFNLVRFHHLDNNWSSGSLFYGMPNTRTFNPLKLDQLFYTIYKLKENGIYSNINLNVSRVFKVSDGIAYADSLPEMGKFVTLFDRKLIELQKEYAYKLLTTINPYTGLPLSNDPAMAMVEILNENSVFRAWRDGMLTTKNKGGVLSYYHTKMLDSLWNDFLFQKYQTSQNLANSWNTGIIPAGYNMIKDGGFENVPINTYWTLEQHNGASGTITKDVINPFAGFLSAKVIINNATGTYWHLQFRQTSISTKKDSVYQIKFAARADVNRSIFVSISLQEDPYTYLGGKEFQLTNNWQEFTFTYVGSMDAVNKTKLAFQFSQTGTYWFDNVSFTTAPINGLLPGESLELKNISRNNYYDLKAFSINRVKDNSEFYINLTNSFFDEMINYLKNSLHIKVPIVATNWNIGFQDLISQSKGDYIDNHAYWDHPQFPNVAWSSTDWLINNTSMTKEFDNSTIPGLFAATKIKGKPYTVSEYNHPFPNRYQAEAPLFLAAYSSLHDIDGTMYFEYNSTYDYTIDKIEGFFSIRANPLFLALNPSVAYLFRNSLISPANNSYNIELNKDDILKIPLIDNGNWSGYTFFDKKLAFVSKTVVESFDAQTTTNFLNFPIFNQNILTSDNNQISLNKNGLLSIFAPKFIGITGFLNQFSNLSNDLFKLNSCNEFGTISLLSLSNDSLINSNKLLLTAVSKVQNNGMIWNSNNTSINNNWGNSPTSLLPLQFNFDLKLNADSIIIYPLNNIGQYNQQINIKQYPNVNGYFNINIDQTFYKTPWYGIKVFPKNLTQVEQDISLVSYNLFNNYPNPFNLSTNISFSIPQKSFVKLIIFDILGNKVKTLIDKEVDKGYYTINWNGTNDNNNILSTGIYLIRLETSQFTKTIKSVLLK